MPLNWIRSSDLLTRQAWVQISNLGTEKLYWDCHQNIGRIIGSILLQCLKQHCISGCKKGLWLQYSLKEWGKVGHHSPVCVKWPRGQGRRDAHVTDTWRALSARDSSHVFQDEAARVHWCSWDSSRWSHLAHCVSSLNSAQEPWRAGWVNSRQYTVHILWVNIHGLFWHFCCPESKFLG